MQLDVPLKAIVIAVTIHMLWGGNTVGAKLGLEMFGPMWSAFIRFALAIVCVGIYARWRGVSLWPRSNEWKPILLIGLLFTLQIGSMNVGINWSTGAMSSVLMATNPLFAALLAHIFIPGDQLRLNRSAGLLVAFAGAVIVLVLGSGTVAFDLAGIGNLVCVFSAAILGGRLVMSAIALQQIDPLRLAIWQMLLSLPLFAVAGGLFETIRWEAMGWRPVAGLLYQGVVVAGIGFTVSFWLMKTYRATVMMSFNFVSPVAGVVLSVLLLREQITAWLIAGMALVALGLVLIAHRQD